MTKFFLLTLRTIDGTGYVGSVWGNGGKDTAYVYNEERALAMQAEYKRISDEREPDQSARISLHPIPPRDAVRQRASAKKRSEELEAEAEDLEAEENEDNWYDDMEDLRDYDEEDRQAAIMERYENWRNEY